MSEDESHERLERGSATVLTEEQIDQIAERAAARVLDKFHLEVGKIAVRSLLYFLGAAGIALAGWFGLEKIGR